MMNICYTWLRYSLCKYCTLLIWIVSIILQIGATGKPVHVNVGCNTDLKKLHRCLTAKGGDFLFARFSYTFDDFAAKVG